MVIGRLGRYRSRKAIARFVVGPALPSFPATGLLLLTCIRPVTSYHPVSLSFTSAALRPDLARVVAGAYLETGAWDSAKERVLSSNALQARSLKSAQRMELEMRKRLQHLTSAQMQLAAHGMADERMAISWLAAMKASRFIFLFASDVLRGKLDSLDPVVRASDYETFFESQGSQHPAVLALSPSSRVKVRSVLLKMVREAGLGEQVGRELRIQRPVIPPAIREAILADSPRWLAGFLTPDSEISSQ